MIERVEHLSVEAERDSFFDWESFGDVDVGVCVMRAADRVTSSVAKLAGSR